MSFWNPNSYSLENQLLDIINGRDVITNDDGSVLKGTDSHVDVYWPSNSDRGHGHAGYDYDDDGNLIGYDIYHD